MELKVSTKHLGLRIALCVLFLAIAVASFTLGVLNYGKKSTGYQTITADTDPEALLYNNAVTFKYYLSGSSNEIKRGIRELGTVYTSLLGKAYKETDGEKEYPGIVSIATISLNEGKTVSVSPELYSVLRDAYLKTEEKKGFNIFAGALYGEWKSILILTDATEFDPLVNEDSKERIGAIAKEVNNLDNFSLEFLDDSACLVRFTTSDSYKAFEKEYEIEASPLTLGNLKDAYMLSMIASGLKELSLTRGYLVTPDGLTVNMDSASALEYNLYTLIGDKESIHSTLPLTGTTTAISFTAYAPESMKDKGGYFHTVEKDGRKYFRHTYFRTEDGEYSDVLLSLAIVAEGTDVVENAYRCMIINTLPTEKEVEEYAAELRKRGILIDYTLQNNAL